MGAGRVIRVTVEMVPGGDDDRAYVLAQGVIVNDCSGTTEVGNYEYGFTGQARRAGHDPGIKRQGRVRGFDRKRKDVWQLLKECLA